jgi:hypothetical protein
MTAHGYDPDAARTEHHRTDPADREAADPATDPGYLAEAADQLRKARDANEARAGGLTWLNKADVPVIMEIIDRRMEIAAAFTRLAECQAASLAGQAAVLGAAWMPAGTPLRRHQGQPEQGVEHA